MRALLARVRDGRADKYLGILRVGAQAGFRVLLGVLVARLAGPEAFAIFVQLITLEVVAYTLWTAAYVTPLGSLAPGLPAADRPGFIRFALFRSRRAALRAGGALLLGTPVATWLGVPAWVWIGFCASTLAWLEANAAIGALASGFRSGTALAATLTGFGVPTCGIVIAHATGVAILPTFFWSNALGHSLACVWMRHSLRMTTAEPRTDERVRAAYRHFGRAAVIGSAANSACTRLQPFVLNLAASTLAVGLFGAANTLVGPVRVVGGALGEVLRPRLALHFGADGHPLRGRRAFLHAATIVAAMGICLVLLTSVAGEVVATLVFGFDYAGLGRVLTAAAAFASIATLCHLLVVAMQTVDSDGPATATRWRVRAAVLSVALVWPACAWDGARGAFVAMTVAELLFLVAAFVWLRGRLPTEGGATSPCVATMGGP